MAQRPRQVAEWITSPCSDTFDAPAAGLLAMLAMLAMACHPRERRAVQSRKRAFLNRAEMAPIVEDGTRAVKTAGEMYMVSAPLQERRCKRGMP